nr:hypothetical protein [Stutzerimonas stutzeri]
MIAAHFSDLLDGADVLAMGQLNERPWAGVRNLGRSGLAACAISALWDLKARLLELPLAQLLGMRREYVAVYGRAVLPATTMGACARSSVARGRLPLGDVAAGEYAYTPDDFR